jgi:hypothetical protein
MIKIDYDGGWLGSTGRFLDCYSPVQRPSGTWFTYCATENNPGYNDPSWYPPGPTGSGRIARVTLVPPSSGLATVSLAGSLIVSVSGAQLDISYIDIAVRSLDCPDVNLDGKVNSSDFLNAAVNLLDSGVDSGATILNDITSLQTQIAISDQSKLHLNDIISVDNEQMQVITLLDGSPDTMSVSRGFNYPQKASHKAGAHIYIATTDGGYDGKYGYTAQRDVNHDGTINTADELTIALMMPITCPSP